MATKKPCTVGGCARLKYTARSNTFCLWHWLLRQPIATQVKYADWRLEHPDRDSEVCRGGQVRARVSQSEWPDGERWCSGCQHFVPLFYCSGSRCRACASRAAHASRVEKTYGITGEEYQALYHYQDGRCYICQKRSPSRRLAVDHDHETGAVRGLLCPDPDRGCNHAVLGPLEASPGGALAAARRMVEYLEDPPYDRVSRGEVAAQAPASPVAADLSDCPF